MGWAATGKTPRVKLQKGRAASTAASGPERDAKNFTRPALAITAHLGGITEHQGWLGLMAGAGELAMMDGVTAAKGRRPRVKRRHDRIFRVDLPEIFPQLFF
jgi:hypothetical protein